MSKKKVETSISKKLAQRQKYKNKYISRYISSSAVSLTAGNICMRDANIYIVG